MAGLESLFSNIEEQKKEIETSKEILKNNLSDFRSYFLSKLKLRKQTNFKYCYVSVDT